MTTFFLFFFTGVATVATYCASCSPFWLSPFPLSTFWQCTQYRRSRRRNCPEWDAAAGVESGGISIPANYRWSGDRRELFQRCTRQDFGQKWIGTFLVSKNTSDGTIAYRAKENNVFFCFYLLVWFLVKELGHIIYFFARPIGLLSEYTRWNV